MNLHVSTLEELEHEIASIQEVLDAPIPDDPNRIVEVGNQIVQYKSRTGKMLADAKHHYNSRMNSDIIQGLRDVALNAPHATPSAVNALVKTMAKNEQYLMNWIERANAACSLQAEWCRSVLSKLREEIKLQGMQNG